MRVNRKKWSAVAALCSLITCRAGADYRDSLMQPATLPKPGRGSVAGTVGNLAYGPAELSRGSHSLATPIEVPDARGALLANVLPSYSPESGLSEWGMGFSNQLTIQRARDLGNLDYASDDFISPWGKLALGSDGTYYVRDFAAPVRFQFSNNTWTALGEDGTRYSFPASEATRNSRGIYTWYLTKVEAVNGEKTELQYDANASGRRFLKTVTYASTTGRAQYRMRLEYDSVAVPVPDYRSGQLVLLDRRVKQVFSEALDAATGQFRARWQHDLAHRQSAAGVAFYLETVTKTYASGEVEPPLTYSYASPEDVLSRAVLSPLEGLDGLLQNIGQDGIQPDVVSFFDYEEDGAIDIEDPYDYARLQRTETGWTRTALPGATGTLSLCRDPRLAFGKRPRELVRMRPGGEPQVLVTARNGANTDLTLCDYLGRPLYQGQLTGAWHDHTNMHVVDLDRDLKPDFVAIDRGRYRVLANRSTASGFGFAPGLTGALSPEVTPLSSGVRDFNGDGQPDLFARVLRGIVVWYGTGTTGFVTNGQEFTFDDLHGETLEDIRSFEMTIGDFNADGLADIVFSNGAYLYMFTNRGTHFAEVSVPGFAALETFITYPVAVDLAGRGEEQAVMVSEDGPLAVTLSRPESGLLTDVDDGKGGHAHFEYERARPNPGIVRRPPLLISMTVSATGEEAIDYNYDYLEPRFHSQSQHLVGYGTVQRTSPLSLEHVEFYNDDNTQGAVLYSATSDVYIPDLFRVEDRTYERTRLLNVAWHRPRKSTLGFRSATASLTASEREVLSYQGVCEKTVTTSNVHGTLSEELTFDRPARLAGTMHCLPRTEALKGTHPGRAELDFDYRSEITHNDYGQVTKVSTGGQVVQEIRYDALRRPEYYITPGHGQTLAGYDTQTGLLQMVTHPDGHVVRVAEFDSLNDQIKALSTALGGGVSHEQFFRYDGYERLSKLWDGAVGSEDEPKLAYAYAWADATHPAHVQELARIDRSAGSYGTRVDYQSSTGRDVARATLNQEGWLFAGLRVDKRTTGESLRYHREPLSADVAPEDMALATLLDPAASTLLSTTQVSTLGVTVAEQETLQHGIVRSSGTLLQIADGKLQELTTVNDTYTSTTTSDGEGHVLSATDPSGAVTRYAYDALGRRVDVTLPDGVTTQSVRYDAQGRPQFTTHEGVGSISYTYDAATGRLDQKAHLTRDGGSDRSEAYVYDEIGRVQTIVQSSSEGTNELEYTYDGLLPEGNVLAGQAGKLTSVTTDAYERVDEFNPDGTQRSSRINLGNWRIIHVESGYFDDGSIRSVRRTVRDAQGNVLNETMRENELDAYGRLERVLLNGATFYDLAYDAEGRVQTITLVNGDVVTPSYDDTTHEERGYQHESGSASVAVDRELSSRGLTSVEHIAHKRALANAETYDRVYQHDARGMLTSMSSLDSDASYDYDDNGLPTLISDLDSERTVERDESQVVVGDLTYVYDGAGRVTQRGDRSYTYGPHGQLARVQRGQEEFSFAYDEQGQRVLKLAHGVPVQGYLEGTVFTENAMIEPVKVMGRVVGVLENGEFRSQLTDPRGTVLVDGDGNYLSTSPYGQRLEHPEFAQAIDYAANGFDADLQLVRMGVRDYDPYLGQFVTPDPLFREDIDRCANSPVQCSLYGYAGSNPVDFSDPSGTQKQPNQDEDTGDMMSSRTEVAVPDAGGAVTRIEAGLGNTFVVLPGAPYGGVPRVEKAALTHEQRVAAREGLNLSAGGKKDTTIVSPDGTLLTFTVELVDPAPTNAKWEAVESSLDTETEGTTQATHDVDRAVSGELKVTGAYETPVSPLEATAELAVQGHAKSKTVDVQGGRVKTNEKGNVSMSRRIENRRMIVRVGGYYKGTAIRSFTVDLGRVNATMYRPMRP